MAVFHVGVSDEAGRSCPRAPARPLAGGRVFCSRLADHAGPGRGGLRTRQWHAGLAVTVAPGLRRHATLFDENGDGNRQRRQPLAFALVVLQPDRPADPARSRWPTFPRTQQPRLRPNLAGAAAVHRQPRLEPAPQGDTLEVRAFDDMPPCRPRAFDLAAALRVNASVHSPLLCVADVFKVRPPGPALRRCRVGSGRPQH